MVMWLFLLSLLASTEASCSLSGFWCCELTNVTELPTGEVTTSASYGTGQGFFNGSQLTLQFSNQPPHTPLTATVDAACGALTFDTGTVWRRAAPPTPITPAPSWASTLSILEVNALAYTSPNGSYPGDGSGTWLSLASKVPYWRSLHIGGIWLAYYSLSTRHFYGVRSVYAALDPPVLDPALGPAADFAALVAACHAAGIRVFLDVIGHGLVNESHYVAEHPAWFSGGSWGMVDYNYSNPEFLQWWAGVWVDYVLTYGVDGFRIDIAEPQWWPVWDNITQATAAAGREIAVWGEGSRYHFSQHDFTAASVTDVAALVPKGCLGTMQLSCHDSGWQSPPGNYFFLQGSRAKFALLGALSPYIPLWLGGDEAWESPVADLPLLQQDLYGKSGKPGGWMYGSQRAWEQLSNASSPAALFAADCAALLALAQQHSSLLAHDTCGPTAIAPLAVLPPSPPPALAPYVRYSTAAAALQAVLVVGNAQALGVQLLLGVPLAAMGWAGRGPFVAQYLYGGDGSRGQWAVTEAQLLAFNCSVPGDFAAGGGATVVLLGAA